uniref:C2H2-type domain-containing protein n=1 Tax=viral metagenome TaxID=1070528 RepID=A0A6C0EY20_9ZZZZ
MPPKTSKIFECKLCDFTSSKESEYNRHLLTGKHKQLTSIENVNNNAKVLSCDLCSKHYFSRVGLWKHAKVCTKKPNDAPIAPETTEVTTNMLVEIVNYNKEMVEIIKEQNKQIKQMISSIQSSQIIPPESPPILPLNATIFTPQW